MSILYMKKAFLFLFDLLLLGLPAGLKAETMANDTLAVYLKNGRIDVFPDSVLKSHNRTETELQITLKNDSLLTYSVAEMDSLGRVPSGFPKFTSFMFSSYYNDEVYTDVAGEVTDSTVKATVPAIGKRLTPTFQLDRTDGKVYVGNALQESTVSRHRFDTTKVYVLTQGDVRQLKRVKIKDAVWSDEKDEVELADIQLTADMFSTNAPSNYGEDPYRMLDGNPNTYFHSTWGTGQYEKLPLDQHPYLEVSIAEDVTKFVFEYVTSGENNNRFPLEIEIQASHDGVDWKTIDSVDETDGMPTSGLAREFVSPVIDLKEAYRRLRFVMTRASYKNYFVLGEFRLKKVVSENEPTGPELIEPAQYAYRWLPFGREVKVDVDWPTDRAVNVPKISIDIEGGKLPADKVTYLQAQINIDGAGVFPDFSAPVQIRGRGNSSWAGVDGKSPYRLKFEESVKPFGLTKGKNWVLLANRQSGSMMANAIGMKIARLVQAAGANDMIPVELYLNGEYRGSYNFTQQVGLHNNSIDIDETNAILIELDTYYDEFQFTSYHYDLSTNVKEPDLEDVPATQATPIFNKVRDNFNNFCKVLARKNRDYENVVNIPMLCRYLIVNEFIRNMELGHPKSTFLYREDMDALHSRYVFGPAWDFDWAFGYEGSYTYYQNKATEDYFYHMGGRGNEFFNDLRYNSPVVKKTYYQIWKNFVDHQLAEVLEYIDDYYKYARPSFEHNATRWGDGYNYAPSCENAKQWLTERANSITESMADYPSEPEPEILKGDVNSDGAVNIADVVCVQNYLQERENERFDAEQADADGNGCITITDVVWIVAMAMQEPANDGRHLLLPQAAASLKAQPFTALVGAESALPVELTVEDSCYTAAQMDVVLPAGLELEKVVLPDALQGHVVETACLSGGHYRVAVYAENGTTFPRGNLALQFMVKASRAINADERVASITDISLVGVKGTEERLTPKSSRFDMNLTGIEGAEGHEAVWGGDALYIEALADSSVRVYAVDGRLVQVCHVKAGNNRISLPSGVYIVNRQKIVVNR